MLVDRARGRGDYTVIAQLINMNEKQHFLFGIPGSDMYMAFGVKDVLEPGAPAQGDVVVGWINTKTGKGGCLSSSLWNMVIFCWYPPSVISLLLR